MVATSKCRLQSVINRPSDSRLIKLDDKKTLKYRRQSSEKLAVTAIKNSVNIYTQRGFKDEERVKSYLCTVNL